jgi:hypothetical protein
VRFLVGSSARMSRGPLLPLALEENERTAPSLRARSPSPGFVAEGGVCRRPSHPSWLIATVRKANMAAHQLRNGPTRVSQPREAAPSLLHRETPSVPAKSPISGAVGIASAHSVLRYGRASSCVHRSAIGFESVRDRAPVARWPRTPAVRERGQRDSPVAVAVRPDSDQRSEQSLGQLS